MIRNEGYNFRKTRQVLTSNDPDYRSKLKKITTILKRLGPADRFFSVDEYGPFSVKQHGGRRRVRKGEYPTVPQYQVSKGRLIVTAALELSTNQVTHFYSDKKDSGEMIALLRLLLKQYSGCRRIYFSWDAAAATWPLGARGQQPIGRTGKTPRVGILMPGPAAHSAGTLEPFYVNPGMGWPLAVSAGLIEKRAARVGRRCRGPSSASEQRGARVPSGIQLAILSCAPRVRAQRYAGYSRAQIG
jgi:hypothetical protein